METLATQATGIIIWHEVNECFSKLFRRQGLFASWEINWTVVLDRVDSPDSNKLGKNISLKTSKAFNKVIPYIEDQTIR